MLLCSKAHPATITHDLGGSINVRSYPAVIVYHRERASFIPDCEIHFHVRSLRAGGIASVVSDHCAADSEASAVQKGFRAGVPVVGDQVDAAVNVRVLDSEAGEVFAGVRLEGVFEFLDFGAVTVREPENVCLVGHGVYLLALCLI